MNVSAYVILQRDKMLGVENIKRKKVVRMQPNHYMESEQSKQVMGVLIDRFQQMQTSQSDVDDCYGQLVNLIESEMSAGIIGNRKVSKCKCTPHKLYWCKELNNYG